MNSLVDRLVDGYCSQLLSGVIGMLEHFPGIIGVFLALIVPVPSTTEVRKDGLFCDFFCNTHELAEILDVCLEPTDELLMLTNVGDCTALGIPLLGVLCFF